MNDYLGWDYAFVLAMSLIMIWALIIGFYLRKNKKELHKKWWFWLISAILFFHLVFVQFLNPSYFGYGTPDYFTKIKVYGDVIVLFDNDASYFDDERSGTEDWTSHLRIHVVDKNTHTKKYSQLIGNNYSTILDDNGIFVVENSMYAYYDEDNVISVISEFDLETRELKPIVTNQQTIEIDGNDVDVFEISALNKIQVKSDQGDMFTYNSEQKRFESSQIDQVPAMFWQFFLNTSINNKDKRQLIINNKATDLEFLLGEIVSTEQSENNGYVLIKWYESLAKEKVKYSMIDNEGEVLWSTNLTIFEKTAGASDFENIQIFTVESDLCYLTINEYLFEMNLFTGRINWWLKL